MCIRYEPENYYGIVEKVDSYPRNLIISTSGIYFNNTVVLLGSGGEKNVRAYQHDPILNAKVEQIKYVAKKINKAIVERDIIVSEDGELNLDNFEVYE